MGGAKFIRAGVGLSILASAGLVRADIPASQLVQGFLPDLAAASNAQSTRQVVNAVNARVGKVSENGSGFDSWITGYFSHQDVDTLFSNSLTSAQNADLANTKQQLGITSDLAFTSGLSVKQVIVGARHDVTDKLSFGVGAGYSDFRARVTPGALLARVDATGLPIVAPFRLPGKAWSAFAYSTYLFNENFFTTAIVGYGKTTFDNSTLKSDGLFFEVNANAITVVDNVVFQGRVAYRHAGSNIKGQLTVNNLGAITVDAKKPSNLAIVGGEAVILMSRHWQPYLRANYEIGFSQSDRSSLQNEVGVNYNFSEATTLSLAFQSTLFGEGVTGVGGLMAFRTAF